MPEPQNLEIELELTYLARELPVETKDILPTKIRDIYLPEDSPMPFIRLRQKGSHYEITKKKPVNEGDFSYQTEQTIPLEQDEFEALAVSSRRMVEKNRYQVVIDGHAAEVDVFSGAFKGLVLIDFEFETQAAKQNFSPPACCLAEVTQELFIAGGQLAGKSFTDITNDLARYNYVKLQA